MLAAHLQRLTRPVRYAMHPDLARALSNYLMIHSRAYNLPAGHREIEQRMGHLMHPEAMPLLTQLLRGTLQGEHDAPGMYLDRLQDAVPGLHQMTPMYSHARGAIGTYGDVLHSSDMHEHGHDDIADLLHVLRGMGQNAAQPAPWVGRHYQQDYMHHPSTANLLGSGWIGAIDAQDYQPAAGFWRVRHNLHDRHPDTELLERLGQGAHGRDPLPHILRIHDIMEQMRGTANDPTREAAPTATGIRDLLRTHLIPHLHGME